MRLRAKWLWLNDNPEFLYLRRKRWYPENVPWAQHKDTAYSRWIRMNQEFMAQWWDYKDFYLGKLDIRDFEAAKLREKELGLKRRLPKLLTEVVLKKLIWWRWAVQDKQFKEYIAIKYPFLKKDDIMNAWVVSKQTKRDILKIISLLRK